MYDASGLSAIVAKMPPDDRAKIVGNALAIAAGVTPKAPPAFAADLHRRGDTRSLESVMAALGQSPKAFMSSSDFKSAIAEAVRVITVESERPRDLSHRAIARQISVKDFRSGTVPRCDPVALAELDSIGAVPSIPASVAEAELSNMRSLGGIVLLTRQSIVNAEWSLLADLIEELRQAAYRAEADAIFGLLASNPSLPDGVALFDSSRGNIASTGGAPSTTTLASSIAALSAMTVNGIRLNLRPWGIVAPVELAMVLAELMESGANRLLEGGFFVSPALTGTAWYLIPDPSQRPVLGLVHVGTATEPVVDTKEGFRSDGVGIRCRHSFAGVVLAPFAIRNEGQ